MPSALRGQSHESEKIVRGRGPRAQPASPARPVSLIQDNDAVFVVEKAPRLLLETAGVAVSLVHYEAGRDNGDAAGAATDGAVVPLLRERLPLDPEPDLIAGRPHRARNAEPVLHLDLPLEGQGRGSEDKHRSLVKHSADKGACRHGEGLPDADLVCQQQTGFPVRLRMLHEQRHKRALPGLKLLPSSVDRGLRHDRRGKSLGIASSRLHRDLPAVGHSVHLGAYRLRERDSLPPDGSELILDPVRALLVVVHPDEFVIFAERAFGLVDRADEAAPRPVRIVDGAGLAVQKEAFPRDHPNLDVPRPKQFVEASVPLLVEHGLRLHVHLVPALLERRLAARRDLKIQKVELRVAYDPYLRYPSDLLSDKLEYRAAEVSRDAEVLHRALQRVRQECPVQPFCSRGETSYAHLYSLWCSRASAMMRAAEASLSGR